MSALDDLYADVERLVGLTDAGFKKPVEPQLDTRLIFTAEEFCGTHSDQLAAIKDREQFQHWLCARQSGKTWGADGAMFENAQNFPRSLNVLLHLTGPAVKIANWVPVWQQGLCERYGIPERCHNQGMMITTFPNEARVMFAGTDDLKHVKNFLGNRLANGIICIDEAQDQPPHVLEYILKVMLPPMLTPTTRVILLGVLPDMPVGKFLDLAAYDPESKTGGKEGSQAYSHHEWARAANIHTPEAMAQLHEYLRKHSISIDDPQIQRDWFRKRIWSTTVGAYGYDASRNAYQPAWPKWLTELYATYSAGPAAGPHLIPYAHPIQTDKEDGARFGLMAAEPPPGVKFFALALDPGGGDRCAVEGWGWGTDSRDVWHLFDWCSPRNANLTTTPMYSVLGLAYRVFLGYATQRGGACFPPRQDTQSQQEIDNLQKDFGIPLVKAAKKTDLKGQVERNRDLLHEGRAHIMAGSPLEQDYQRTKWDPDARAKGIYRWPRGAGHPDPSEAGRYGLGDYFDAFEAQPEEPKTDIERHRAEVKAALAEVRERDEEDEDGTRGMGWG